MKPKPKPEESTIPPDKLRRATKRVRRVFQEAWDDYHKYKPDNTKQLASSRAPGFEVGETANQRKLERARLLLEQSALTDASGEDFDIIAGPGPSSTSHSQTLVDRDVATVTDKYGAQEVPWDTTRFGFDSKLRPTKKPVARSLIATHSPNAPPKYDWCTYTNLSVKPPSELLMPFLPYGWSAALLEAQRKNFEKNLDKDCPAMLWLAAYRRPSEVAIMLETVKRLLGEKMEKLIIDRTRVLSRTCQELLSLEPWLPAYPTPDTKEWTMAPRNVDDELKSRESKDADGYYCCIPGGGFFCRTHYTHGTDHAFLPRPIPDTKEPQFKMAAAPCSADCAWHISTQDPEPAFEATPSTRLTNDNVDHLRVFLASPAGLTYCDVSDLLANVSCREIFLHLRDWRKRASIEHKPTPTPSPTQTQTQAPTPDPAALYKKEVPVKFENPQTGHCEHKGPCVSGECVCASTDNHSCEANCHCDLQCPRRWRGCRCAASGSCAPVTCECQNAGRECDPRLCRCCPDNQLPDALHKGVYGCGNLRLAALKKTPLKTIVKASLEREGGYGLFASTKIAKHEVIHEYVGEIVTGEEADRREPLYEHTRRNYNFGLDAHGARLIDGYRLGNASRFINGRSGRDANLTSKLLNVNGDIRILILTSRPIKPGEELFLDYGRLFGSYGSSTKKAAAKRKAKAQSDENAKRPKQKQKSEPKSNRVSTGSKSRSTKADRDSSAKDSTYRPSGLTRSPSKSSLPRPPSRQSTSAHSSTVNLNNTSSITKPPRPQSVQSSAYVTLGTGLDRQPSRSAGSTTPRVSIPSSHGSQSPKPDH